MPPKKHFEKLDPTTRARILGYAGMTERDKRLMEQEGNWRVRTGQFELRYMHPDYHESSREKIKEGQSLLRLAAAIWDDVTDGDIVQQE